MQFAVGYQLPDAEEESLVEVIADYREAVAEIYFPWADMPSGRAALATRRGYTDWTAQHQLLHDLAVLREMGLRLDLLFNANCYGGRAISRWLENQVCSALDCLGEAVGGVDIVTTTSPFIAHVVKQHHPQVETRASVNMRIGTVKGMQYLADLFDSYHVQRDNQRNLEYLADLKSWADENAKRLVLLANSGCLAFCSGQTFHDNMVAHEAEIDETVNVTTWEAHTCRRFLEDRANWVAILQSTWIRPEDIHRYEGLCSVAKLATRMHARPRLVIDAYARGSFYGNLLDLCEPGFGPALAPYVIDNSRFPADWFARTSSCDHRCHRCDYCAHVLDLALINAQQAP